MKPTPEEIAAQQAHMLKSAIERERNNRKRSEKQTVLGFILAIGLGLLAGVAWVKCNQARVETKTETNYKSVNQ